MPMSSEQLFFAVRRGGKWVAKRIEDAKAEDFQGVDFGRDFMSALVSENDVDAALIQVETNLRTGEDPLEALRKATSSSEGLALVRNLARQGGYRVTLV
jgi:hypothetical protein